MKNINPEMLIPKAPDVPRYMTFVARRSDPWKTHTKLAHAKRALMLTRTEFDFHCGGIIYEWSGRTYVPVFAVAAGQKEIPWLSVEGDAR